MMTRREHRCSACDGWHEVDERGEWRGTHGWLTGNGLQMCKGQPVGRGRTRHTWVCLVLTAQGVFRDTSFWPSGRDINEAVAKVQRHPLYGKRKWALR